MLNGLAEEGQWTANRQAGRGAFLVLVSIVFMLTACSKQEQSQKPPAVAPAASTQSVPANPKAAQATARPEIATEPANRSTADWATPLEQFVALNPGADDFALIYLARGGKPLGDDERLLSIFSRIYRVESNAFKRQELAPLELERIRKEVVAHNDARYRYVSIALGGLDIGPYDFQKKGFPIQRLSPCATGKFKANADIVLNVRSAPDHCIPPLMPVPDIDLAKRLEDLRARMRADLRFTLYLHIETPEADRQLDLTPIALRLQVRNVDEIIANDRTKQPVTIQADLVAR